MTVLLAAVLALGIGVSLGAVGGGGSILAVPVLIGVAGLSVESATTSSLVVVGLASLVGMASHHRAGRVRVGAGLGFGAAGVGGALVGTRLNDALDGDVLLLGFAVVMLVVAARMATNLRRPGATPATTADLPGLLPLDVPEPVPVLRADGSTWHDGAVVRHFRDHAAGATATAAPPAAPPPAAVATPAVRALQVLATGTAVGLLTGLFGVGGGFVIVPALVLVLGFPLAEATGTSLLVIAVNSAVALVLRGGVDPADWPVDWSVTVPFAAAAVVGVLAGRRVADRVPTRTLTAALTALIVAVALWTGTTAVIALTA